MSETSIISLPANGFGIVKEKPGGVYSKNPYIRTVNFEGQAAAGSYLMISVYEFVDS